MKKLAVPLAHFAERTSGAIRSAKIVEMVRSRQYKGVSNLVLPERIHGAIAGAIEFANPLMGASSSMTFRKVAPQARIDGQMNGAGLAARHIERTGSNLAQVCQLSAHFRPRRPLTRMDAGVCLKSEM